MPASICRGLRNDAMKRRLATLMNLAHISDEKFFVTNIGYATYALAIWCARPTSSMI